MSNDEWPKDGDLLFVIRHSSFTISTMLVFDQLKKDDRQLRLLALVAFAGMFVLLAGLWWVQVARSRDYQAHLETQSFRIIRTFAVRGRILDRNGQVLVENRLNYSVSLYFE